MKDISQDIYNAFILKFHSNLEGAQHGFLQDLNFGIKDVFDIKGYPTSFGSPDWLNSHPIPIKTTPIVEQLLNEGAKLVGKTHTDELTYSILGMNAHYGTPLNPLTPNRVPGGSSSGSAVAVAGNLVDFAIGTDTGGSVRAPASFCGLFGIRPTHAKISLEHARPLAKSFDTLGWFARDSQTLYKIGQVLFNETPKDLPDYQFVIPQQALEILPESLKIEFIKKVESLFSGQIKIENFKDMHLSSWAEVFRIIQAKEIWEEHGDWAKNYLDHFGPGIKQRFLIASEVSEPTAIKARNDREQIQIFLNSILTNNQVLIVPTVANLAPLLNSKQEELELFRKSSFQLLCMAGLGGLPQISIPAILIDGCGFGISVIGAKNSDIQLLDFVRKYF